MNPLAVARGSATVPDGVLVQEAAAGGGGSYAALYDRYSDQVYNYCLRLTGSPHDAADATQDAFVNVLGRLQQDDRPVLDFASYLFAAARNESYALMRKRSRAQPTDDVPDRAASQPNLETDPEPAVLLRDSQETVRRANAQLPPRYREVLALREVAGRSYDEIGQIMGISENAAAQLIFRARGKLKSELTAGAVASVVVATDDCEHARLLINRLEDGEPITDEEQLWLDEHLEHCGSCRAARGVLLEVGASYRAWAVVPVIAALRPEVLTRAGELIGVDWSGVAASTPVGSGGANGSAAGSNGSGADPGGSGAGAGGGADPSASGAGAGGSGGQSGIAGGGLPKPRGHHAAAQGALGATVLAVAGIVAAGILHDGSPVTRDAAPAEVVRPAEESSAGAAASGSKADGSATAAKAAGIHGFQAAGAAPVVSNLPAAGPEKRSSGAPGSGERGSSPDGSPGPNGGGPKTSPPGPGGQGPGSGRGDGPGNGPGPGSGGPGSGPGEGPGSGNGGPGGGGPGDGQPGPGGGPANPPGSPGGTPGGGQTDPPGQPTDPGGGQTPPDPPPAGGGDCSWPGHGNGPGGCPPGHGGTPPGQGKR